MVLDNAAFHKAKRLSIPENIVLIFQPPYAPELNAAEKIWAKFKKIFTNRLFKEFDELSQFLEEQCKQLTLEKGRSITSFDYVFLPYMD